MRVKNFFKKLLEYLTPALICMAIFVVAMIIKGVYPFGNHEVGYIDYDDQVISAYTGLWDLFHGSNNLFVNWNFGAGGSMITGFFINGFLSPISWLIALFPRASIGNALSILFIIKVALMATTAYYCFKKLFPKLSFTTLLTFSILWTFSGWFLVYFTNIGWLDLMILLPLLFVFAKELAENGKSLKFILVLTYMLTLSYYISYMILVALVIVSTLYVCMFSKEKKKTASKLFFAVIISILISCVAFIPSCLTSLGAHRFANIKEATVTSLFDQTFSKLVVLLLTPLPLILYFKLMFTYKKDKKNVQFFILCFVIMSIGLVIETINAMWHSGSYFCFPFRYSFAIIFLLILGSLYYLNKYHTKSTNMQFIKSDLIKIRKNLDNATLKKSNSESFKSQVQGLNGNTEYHLTSSNTINTSENVVDLDDVNNNQNKNTATTTTISTETSTESSFAKTNNYSKTPTEEKSLFQSEKQSNPQSSKFIEGKDNEINANVDEKHRKMQLVENRFKTAFPFIMLIAFGILTLLSATLIAVYALNMHPYKAITFYEFSIFLICFVLFIAFLVTCSKLKLNTPAKTAKVKKYSIYSLSILLVMVFACGYIGNITPNTSHQTQNIYLINTSQVESPYKVKDADYLYEYNFSQIANIPSMQTWIHINPDSQFVGYEMLGYNHINSTPLLSSGGTIMTDILLGNKYIISTYALNSTYYTEVSSFDYYKYNNNDYVKTTAKMYKLNFDFSNIFTTNTNFATLLENTDNLTHFDIQNKIYKALFGTTTDVMSSSDVTFAVSENDENFTITITATSGKIVYMDINTDDKIFVASGNEKNNYFYGLNDLGVSEGSKTIVISKSEKTNKNLTKEILENSLTFATFDVESFKTNYDELSQNTSSLTFDGNKINVNLTNTDNNTYAIVPYTYLKNMKATLNGNNVSVEPVFNTFMMVELVDGENNIVIGYEPQYLNISLIITIVAIVLLIIFAILNKKFKLNDKKFVIWIGFVGAIFILAVVSFLVYLKPLYNFFKILI